MSSVEAPKTQANVQGGVQSAAPYVERVVSRATPYVEGAAPYVQGFASRVSQAPGQVVQTMKAAPGQVYQTADSTIAPNYVSRTLVDASQSHLQALPLAGPLPTAGFLPQAGSSPLAGSASSLGCAATVPSNLTVRRRKARATKKAAAILGVCHSPFSSPGEFVFSPCVFKHEYVAYVMDAMCLAAYLGELDNLDLSRELACFHELSHNTCLAIDSLQPTFSAVMTPTLQVPIDYRLAADGTLQSTPSCNVEECRASIASVRGVLRKLETFFCEFLDEIENVSAPIALDLLEFEGIPHHSRRGLFHRT